MVKRETWSSKAGYVFTAVGCAAGLGNMWRFPYLTFKYGGGAFFIPYLISALLIAIPLLYLLLSIGHMGKSSPPRAFRSIVGKKAEWAGWIQELCILILNSYYVVITAWAICYIAFSSYLPWGEGAEAVSGVNNFFYNEFIGLSESIEIAGGFSIPVVVATILVWFFIYLICSKGIKRIEKVSVYFVFLAWILLIIFSIRGAMLPGGIDIGLRSYLTPDFSAMLDPEVWASAASQAAFSLALGGGMAAYASYLPEKADVNKYSLIIGFLNMFTSILAGFAVFSSAGFLAYSLGVEVSEVTLSGIPLLFITLPTAISMMPAMSQVFGILCFTSIFMLAFTSAYGIAGAFITTLIDNFKISRKKATALTILIPMTLSIFVFARGFGMHWLDMVDRGVCYYGVMIGGLVMCIIFGWVYDPSKLREHTNRISTIHFGRWLDIIIKFVIPIVITFEIVWGLFVSGDIYGYFWKYK